MPRPPARPRSDPAPTPRRVAAHALSKSAPADARRPPDTGAPEMRIRPLTSGFRRAMNAPKWREVVQSGELSDSTREPLTGPRTTTRPSDPDRGSPTGVHRRVPALGGRQGTASPSRRDSAPSSTAAPSSRAGSTAASRSTPGPAGTRLADEGRRPCRSPTPERRALLSGSSSPARSRSTLDRQGRVLAAGLPPRDGRPRTARRSSSGRATTPRSGLPARWDDVPARPRGPGRRSPQATSTGLGI